ncbi:MAG: FHA domain-containing protein [Oscillospiraceae bacterium]|nr:FHA domain-containing protein [Oscillospiraceae bacterium]
MAHTRCRNGHIYDMEIYGDSCPYCGSVTSTIRFDAGARREITFSEQGPVRPAEPAGAPVKREHGREITFFEQGAIGPTEPVWSPTMRNNAGAVSIFGQSPVSPAEPAGAPVKRGHGGPADTQQQDFGKTVPAFAVNVMNMKEAEQTEIVPAVGWLVCVAGPVKGLDFTLHAQINKIGCGDGMDVRIPGDDAISADTHAKIVYDRRHAVCYLLPGNDGSILSLNGDPVLGPQKLGAYDRLCLGRTELLFVPFCNEHFAWADGE